MKILAPAKVNLALDILGQEKRSGFHYLQTIYLKIPLYDEIELQESDEWKFEFFTQKKFLREDIKEINPLSNIFHKVLQHYQGQKKYFVKVNKNIPVGAGLGGASSNAAALLKFLQISNKYQHREFKKNENSFIENYKLKIKNCRAADKSLTVGADVNVFMTEGQLFLGEYFGEKLTKLDFDFSSVAKKVFIYLPRKLRSQTQNAFSFINLEKCAKNKNKTERILELIKNNSLRREDLPHLLHNDFLQIKELSEVSEKLQNRAFLTGSGSAFFAFEDIGCSDDFIKIECELSYYMENTSPEEKL